MSHRATSETTSQEEEKRVYQHFNEVFDEFNEDIKKLQDESIHQSEEGREGKHLELLET